jgi:MFS family permease
MLALAAAPGQPVAFAIGVLMGFTSITFMTTSTALVQLRADPRMRGRVLALQALVFLGSTPIGGPIVGAISQRWGARYALALGALATLAAGLYGLATVRTARALELSEEVSAEAIADAATSMGEGPKVALPGAAPS